MQNKYRYTILVNSCEKNKILIEPFLDLLKVNVPFYKGIVKTTLTSVIRHKDFDIENIINKPSKSDFSSNLIAALKEIKTDYVLFFLEDFFLLKPINKKIISSAIDVLNEDSSVNAICLNDFVDSNKICSLKYNELFDIKNKMAPYNCNCQLTLWRRKFLINLLRRGENAWEFEYFGTFRIHRKKGKLLYINDYNRLGEKLYPDGGILKGGLIREDKIFLYKKCKVNLNFAVYFNKLTHDYKSNTFVNSKGKINRLIGIVYPYLSIYFPFLKRIGCGVPNYIFNECCKY